MLERQFLVKKQTTYHCHCLSHYYFFIYFFSAIYTLKSITFSSSQPVMASLHSSPLGCNSNYILHCFFLWSFSLIEASNGGFSVDLIHHDSPNSPFFYPSKTASQCIAMALHPSINHINHFKQTSSPSPNQAQVDIISNVGEYLMKYSLGTPPMQILGFVDKNG